MKNTMTDLHNHLFMQMERLNDDSLCEDSLALELRRARAMTDVADAIIDNASLSLKAAEYQVKNGSRAALPKPMRVKDEQ